MGEYRREPIPTQTVARPTKMLEKVLVDFSGSKRELSASVKKHTMIVRDGACLFFLVVFSGP